MPRYWISHDLGIRGNYDELYAWLDGLGAKECGESVGTFVSDVSREQLTRELKKLVGPSGRVYMITTKAGGKFIIGKRRAAPWAGYAVTELDSETEK
jgi:hypothetical protein